MVKRFNEHREYTPNKEDIELLYKYRNYEFLFTISGVGGFSEEDEFSINDFFGNNDDRTDIVKSNYLDEYHALLNCVKKYESMENDLQEIFDLELFRRIDCFASQSKYGNMGYFYKIYIKLPTDVNECKELYDVLSILKNRLGFDEVMYVEDVHSDDYFVRIAF